MLLSVFAVLVVLSPIIIVHEFGHYLACRLTGIRVNEVIAADLMDVNLRIGFFTCPGEAGKARIVPIGKPARVALEDYITTAREAFLTRKEGDTTMESALLDASV